MGAGLVSPWLCSGGTARLTGCRYFPEKSSQLLHPGGERGAILMGGSRACFARAVLRGHRVTPLVGSLLRKGPRLQCEGGACSLAAVSGGLAFSAFSGRSGQGLAFSVVLTHRPPDSDPLGWLFRVDKAGPGRREVSRLTRGGGLWFRGATPFTYRRECRQV